ncbi:MAG: hypothetical protein AB201_02640 [Parcubacteria bacterium C7867-006]|nr:MAG: hypothetical protein AB201_02640 [Parcubacteria bacterium C7867-006]
MLDKIKQIKDWFKKVTKTKNSYEKGEIKPTRDWRVILTTTFFVLVILGGVASFFYFQVSNGSLFSVSPDMSDGEIKINRPLFDKAVADINIRKTVFERVKDGKNIPSDPSL